jgi:signal transduction histidine kinase
MVLVRFAGAVFAAYQVAVYDNEPYPSVAYRNAGLVLAGFLALANLAILAANGRVRTLSGARALGVAGIAVDTAVASGFVWLFTFDQLSALWVVLFILPLEGAIIFQLRGALATWAIVTAIYVARELWGARTFPEDYVVGVQWSSVTFRMGIALLIAMVVGLMARDLVRERSRLREALQHVQRVDRLRSRLVSTLAHDVRNPLTAIRGTIKTMLAHRDRLTPKQADELLTQADRQSERLERLATDLLDLARIERGRLELELEDVRLRDVVENALSFADDQSRYEVRIDPGLRVRADPGRLEQIVVNLATNALRYGEPPFVAEAGPSDGTVTLSLLDHGPGVPADEAGSLFEPFRAERGHGSVGLGLAIVKALAEAHGGEVRYRPNRPRGARFEVSLPSSGSPDR